MRTTFACLAFIVLNSATQALAEPPHIPKPEKSIQEVVEPAKAQFEKWYSENKSEFSTGQTLESFFLAKLEYTNVFLDKYLDKWEWVATFESHQIANKRFTFIVGKDKIVGIWREQQS